VEPPAEDHEAAQAGAEDPVAGVPSEAAAEAAGWAVRPAAAAAWEAAAGSKEAPEEEAPEDRGAAPGAEDQAAQEGAAAAA